MYKLYNILNLNIFTCPFPAFKLNVWNILLLLVFNNPYLLDEAEIERKAFCLTFCFQILKLNGTINQTCYKIIGNYFNLIVRYF